MRITYYVYLYLPGRHILVDVLFHQAYLPDIRMCAKAIQEIIELKD